MRFSKSAESLYVGFVVLALSSCGKLADQRGPSPIPGPAASDGSASPSAIVAQTPEAGGPTALDAAYVATTYSDAESSPPLDVAGQDEGSPDVFTTEDAPYQDAGAEASVPTPPIAIAGLAVWLDGTMGVVASDPDGGIATWADRSGLGNVFLGEALVPNQPPQTTDINGLGAVAFTGGLNRVIIEEYPSPAEKEALTFESGEYALAIVFRADAPITDGGALGDPILAMARTPWLGNMPTGFLPDSAPLSLTLSASGLITLSVTGGPYVHVVGTASLLVDFVGVPHLLIVSVSGPGVAMRLDGKPLAVLTTLDPPNPSCPYVLPQCVTPFDYAPVYLGGWDWPFTGFRGSIGDFVLIKGNPAGDLNRLESYLLAKYGF